MALKKKTASKKKVVKKTTTTKKVSSTAVTRVRAIPTKQTKTQILTAIAEETELTRAQVAAVFAAMDGLVTRHLMKRGSGEFTIPDIGLKVRKVVKPRTKARMGRNPATGESIKIAAKPARTVIKAVPLAAMKAKLG